MGDDNYCSFSHVTRCLHYPAFKQAYDAGHFISHDFSSADEDVDDVGEVLWFAPDVDLNEHNFYGNVSLTVSTKDIMRRFSKVNYYFIDRIETDTHVASRVLITDYEYDLEVVDLFEDGSPLMKKPWQYLIECMDSDGDILDHVVEMAFEVTQEDCEWLWDICDIQANDHSRANSVDGHGNYHADNCHKYNNFGKKCPFQRSRHSMNNFLKKKCPGLFN